MTGDARAATNNRAGEALLASVMTAPVADIHVFSGLRSKQCVDGRGRPDHDEVRW